MKNEEEEEAVDFTSGAQCQDKGQSTQMETQQVPC